MPEFEKTKWANSEFSQNYRDDANIYLPFRSQFIEIVKSFYGHFIHNSHAVKILDLGCGDGLFIQELLKEFSPGHMTLVDGSEEMLNAAKKRIGENKNIHFIKANFLDLQANDILNNQFDFVYSSLAIHHLPFREKKKLYSYIYKHLTPSGCFIHYDVVAPTSKKLENWYLLLWKEWISEHPCKEQALKLLNIPEQYKSNPENIPDTLSSQLEALKDIGFKEVSCYFRYGIFTLFGGFK